MEKKNPVIGIYRLLIGKKYVYVGQSININLRWSKYKLLCIGKDQVKLKNVLKKYGIGKTYFEILEECEESKLNEREKFWIKKLNTFNTKAGLNLTSGGSGGRRSKETRLKMSIAQKARTNNYGNIKHFKTPYVKGGTPWNKGTSWDSETKDKISSSLKGNVCAIRRPVIQYDLKTKEDLKEFPSLAAAAREMKGGHRGIFMCANNKGKKAYGYGWKYKQEKQKSSNLYICGWFLL